MDEPRGPQDLLRHVLADDADLEVIVSVAEMPPNTTSPTHTHPGEEFCYLVEGEIFFEAEGQEEIRYTAGDCDLVAHGQVHWS